MGSAVEGHGNTGTGGLKMKLEQLPTPCYVLDEERLIQNLTVLRGVMNRTGCKILLAQKAFSMFSVYPLIGQYLSGTAASGLYEARLGREEMNLENHVYSPAYREAEFGEIAAISDHVVFNSMEQLQRYSLQARKAGASVGLRINPECSTQEGHEIYDPCAPGSRLGIPAHCAPAVCPAEVEGLHFHTLCEQNADALEKTLEAVEERFAAWLPGRAWINFGGGHHITREDYDIPLLERCILRMRERYGLEVYLEPGEAVALNAGYLETTVLEIVENDISVAIVDTSAACHMPDVLEMPYRPPLHGSGRPGEKRYNYRLAGPTCLAGDVIGEYSFDEPLRPGDRLTFGDMAIYSMVKNNTFNGMPLPSIAIRHADDEYEMIRCFHYEDFRTRLS